MITSLWFILAIIAQMAAVASYPDIMESLFWSLPAAFALLVALARTWAGEYEMTLKAFAP